MALAPFLENLFTDGNALVDPPAVSDPQDLRDCRALLAAEEAKVRIEFPGQAPEFNLAAAIWGAETLLRICQLAIFRATSEVMIAAAFSEKCPEGHPAEKHYAVDLTWRFLPDLFRFANSVAPDDPLVKALKLAAAEWPLSSIGIPGIDLTSGSRVHLDEVLNHPGLYRIYLDRVIARKATDHLQEPRVLSGVLASVGMHTSLIADWKRTWPQEILSKLAVAPLE